MDPNQNPALMCTPKNKKPHHLHKLMGTTPAGLQSPAVRIPPTPFLKRLGYGTGIDVFLYERSPLKNGKMNSPWALKRLQKRKEVDTDIAFRLEEEASVLKRLSHPNIIGYRGYKTQPNGNKVLAMEDGQQSLMDVIEEMNDNSEETGVREYFPGETIEKVVLGCAKALDYLHTKALLLHGDLKSGNVLIKNSFDEVKLCDFGVTVPLDSQGNAMEGSEYVGTDLWSAPEIINGEKFSHKADIFALGLVIYEMFSLQFPHMTVPNDDSSIESDMDESGTEMMEDMDERLGTRPPLPDDIDYTDEYKKVLQVFFASTQADPNGRPSAKQIVELLES